MSRQRFPAALLMLPILSLAPLAASIEATIPVVAEAAASRLGDLSSFRTIVVDTAAFVDKGDLPGAKTSDQGSRGRLGRCRSWSEATVRGRLACRRQSDRPALDVVRASQPVAATCKQALADLLATMDRMSGQS